jgi:hypothetical protein
MKILLRTLIMIVPVLLLSILEALRLLWCVVKCSYMHIFNINNPWPLDLEWFQLKASVLIWYDVWLNGFGDE